jgi:RNA processing factor Prp31
MSSTVNYVADHIDRIERRHRGKPSCILDSKWRIASAIDLFAEGTLASDGTLTPEQQAKVDAYIERFKTTPAGKEALAQYQRRAG